MRSIEYGQMAYIAKALCASGSELANSLKQKSEDQATKPIPSGHIVFCFEWQQVIRCVVVYDISYLLDTLVLEISISLTSSLLLFGLQRYRRNISLCSKTKNSYYTSSKSCWKLWFL